MLKALLIDLDGTLVDTTPALYQVYLKFLEHYGKKGNREEFESLIGPSIDEIVEILKEKYKLKGTSHDLSTMYISLLMMQGLEGTELFPGAKSVIDQAKEKKLKLAIVTSGTRPLVKICLDPLKVSQCFDTVVTSEDVEKAKPNPEMYQIALKKLGVDPSEAVAIEDSPAGVEAAKGAGLEVIMITHDKPLENKKSDPSVKYLQNWDEIGTWLRSK